MIDLSNPKARMSIADRVGQEIDNACIRKYDDGHRNHLGASLIGHECKRYLWYVFRHAFHKVHSGQLYRLFNRGHKEEERILEWLRWIGFQVWDTQEDGTQFRISDVCGHFGGSLDGVCKFPINFGIEDPCLLEFKTQKGGSGFDNLIKNGVALEKPIHFDQMSIYGYKYQLRFALYVAVCKNDDRMHIELVELDWERAKILLLKAEEIINATEAPERAYHSSAAFQCKWCDMREVCYGKIQAQRSCRSCKHFEPRDDGEWECVRNITPGKESEGCVSSWESIC